jgi:hypothetical protein
MGLGGRERIGHATLEKWVEASSFKSLGFVDRLPTFGTRLEGLNGLLCFVG